MEIIYLDIHMNTKTGYIPAITVCALFNLSSEIRFTDISASTEAPLADKHKENFADPRMSLKDGVYRTALPTLNSCGNGC